MGMVVSILIFSIFLLDLVLPSSWAFFQKGRPVFDIIFVVCAAGLGYLSWVTLREQDK